MRKSRLFTARRVASFVAITWIAAGAASSFAVDCCSYNGGPCNIIPPLAYGVAPWNGATACGVTFTGTNCDIELSGNVTLTSGTCITLGTGVTLDFKGYEIACTDDDCTAAVKNTNSGGASDKVVIQNGTVRGCFQRGLWFDGGTNGTATDMRVDLARDGGGACNNPILTAAIFTPRGELNRVVAKNGFVGIYAQPGEDITDAYVSGNYVGIAALGASSAAVDLTNVQFIGNGYNVKNHNPGTYITNARAISLQDPAGCHCIDASNACVTDIADCFDFGPSSSAGNASFLEDVIVP